jgi:hypothetical protein
MISAGIDGILRMYTNKHKIMNIAEPALTWDDLADLYKRRTGGTARNFSMDEIWEWAVSQEDIYEDFKGRLHLVESPSTNHTKKMNYPYNHYYTMSLSIGLANASQTEKTNPAFDSSYSEEEWNSLTEQEKQSWLDQEAWDWAKDLIETSISH